MNDHWVIKNVGLRRFIEGLEDFGTFGEVDAEQFKAYMQVNPITEKSGIFFVLSGYVKDVTEMSEVLSSVLNKKPLDLTYDTLDQLPETMMYFGIMKMDPESGLHGEQITAYVRKALSAYLIYLAINEEDANIAGNMISESVCTILLKSGAKSFDVLPSIRFSTTYEGKKAACFYTKKLCEEYKRVFGTDLTEYGYKDEYVMYSSEE